MINAKGLLTLCDLCHGIPADSQSKSLIPNCEIIVNIKFILQITAVYIIDKFTDNIIVKVVISKIKN